MFGLENRGETFIFMSRYFDKTMTILISYFLHFLTCDYFVLRINKITYSKKKKKLCLCMWKIIFVKCPRALPLVANGGPYHGSKRNCRATRGAIFFKHIPEDAEWYSS